VVRGGSAPERGDVNAVRSSLAPAIIHLTWVMLPDADPWDSAALGLIGTKRGQP